MLEKQHKKYKTKTKILATFYLKHFRWNEVNKRNNNLCKNVSEILQEIQLRNDKIKILRRLKIRKKRIIKNLNLLQIMFLLMEIAPKFPLCFPT
jgi:hypothetical protein